MNTRSVKLMAVLALLAGFSLSNTAVAQTAAASDNPDTALNLDKLVVTGSNIPRAADALSVPVAVIGLQEIDKSGVSVDLLDVLRKVSPNISGVGQENAQIYTGNNFGGASVNIKGLNTLVLVNGRRVAFSPAESTGGSQFVDLNLIPVAAIQQVEVLQDGASAIYGSDAIGGVINIILKKDYNGWEVGAHYGWTQNTGHYKEKSGYVVGGASNDKTSLTIGLDYAQYDPMYLKDRSFTNPIYGTRSYPGLIDITDLATGKDQFYQLKAGLNAPPAGANQTIDQLVASGIYNPVTRTQALQVFNLASGETLQGALKRYSATISGEHKVFGDSLVAFTDIIAANTKTYSSLNAQPVVPYLQDPYIDINALYGFSPPPAGTTYVPVTSPANPFSQAYVDQAADGNTGKLIFVRNRFVDYPRLYQNDSTLFRAVGGLRGKINDDYSWEAAANLNRYQLNYTNTGLIDTNALANALNDGTINPWAIKQNPGAFDGVVGEAFVNMLSTLNSFDAKLTGTPYELPAGKIGFAIGTQYIKEGLAATPDVNSLPNSSGTTQGWSNATTFNNFNATRNVTSFYAEVEVPIVSAAQHVTAAHAINLDVAARHDAYSGHVGSTTNPQASISWQPLDDSLKIRATVGRSFIAPTLYSLYGPTNAGASDAINYTAKDGTAYDQVQFNSVSGSNPNLKPSTANSWSVGFVYTPKEVKGLSVTIDYSDISQKQIVGSIPQATIIQDVETNGTASPYINLVRLNTPTGATLTGPGQVSSHSPQSIWIVANLTNLAGQKLTSTDAAIEYKWKTASLGRFDVASKWTYYSSYKLQVVPTESFYEYTGLASQNEGTVPKFRTYSTFDWSNWGVDATLGLSWISRVSDVGVGGSTASDPVGVGSYTQFDLALSYEFKELHYSKFLDGLKVTAGVNNLTNKQPPLASNAFQNTNADVGTYDGSIGRFFYVNAKYSF